MNIASILRIAIPVVLAGVLIGGYKLWLRLFLGVVIIPEDGIGIVEKKFVILGANTRLPDGKIVALNGEAGIQADTLAPGLHYGKWPWQYRVRTIGFTEIEPGTIGVVKAIDGAALPAGRILAKTVDCDSYQNARAFLQNGGERGAQLAILPPGKYRINTEVFQVEDKPVTQIKDNMVGVVTTREGRPLPTGDIAGAEVPGHNSFQDAQAFINGKGTKGLQEQLILAGQYYINPLFAQVEEKPMTEVPIGSAGVVISYVGDKGEDRTGETFKHGNIVSKGQRGVWIEPLDPGKYPLNPYCVKTELVPTTNVVLNWATGKNESHNLDKNLSTITVRSSDGFPFNLDVSQIIHVPRTAAPKVIARFGNMTNLVTQVLEPTIGNYFRNAAQSSDVIDFLKNRSSRQNAAKDAISKVLEAYDVQAVDTLIGDIVPPEALMKTLTDRKLAQEQKETFESQRIAEQSRQDLNKARSLADIQDQIVTAERGVEIAEKHAQSAVKKAEGEATSVKIAAQGAADAKTLNATADANVFRTVGSAEAEKIQKVGLAEAEVIEKKTQAVGQQNYAFIEIGRALAEHKIPLVPEIVAGGGNGDNNGGLVNTLLALMVKEKMTTIPAETANLPSTLNGLGKKP
jgi:uncharacterized membrane protein YqiK